MEVKWDRQADETEEWYDRFMLYLYMGPQRTIAAAHSFATRMAQGAALGQLSSWRGAARRYQWRARAAAFDGEVGRATVAEDERLRMVAELLQQVYGVLRHAELQTLSKEEARQLLPTFRLFFRDLLRLHQSETTQQVAVQGEAGLRADDLLRLMKEGSDWETIVAELRRVTIGDEEVVSEEQWRPLRDVLAQLYPDETSARRMAAQAHLDVARIHFSPRAVDSWHAILTEAAHAGRIEAVIAAAQAEYGANSTLVNAARHFHQARVPTSRPTGTAQGSKRGKKQGAAATKRRRDAES